MVIPKAIIADADGTLVNTLYIIRHGQYEGFKAYVKQASLGVNFPDYDTYEAHLNTVVGADLRDSLHRTAHLLYPNRPDILEKLDFESISKLVRPIQDNLAPRFVKAYDGLDDLLSLLSKKDIKFGIFTSGSPHNVVRNFGIALPKLGLSKLFKDNSIDEIGKVRIFEATIKKYYNLPDFVIVTAHDVTAHKPDPESLKLAMERLSVLPTDCLVMGDHKFDMQSGVNAGAPQIIGITHGFDDRETLIEAGATDVIDSLPELVAKLSH